MSQKISRYGGQELLVSYGYYAYTRPDIKEHAILYPGAFAFGVL